jgi:hypothetical protein
LEAAEAQHKAQLDKTGKKEEKQQKIAHIKPGKLKKRAGYRKARRCHVVVARFCF